MVCCLFHTQPLSKQMMTSHQLHPKKETFSSFWNNKISLTNCKFLSAILTPTFSWWSSVNQHFRTGLCHQFQCQLSDQAAILVQVQFWYDASIVKILGPKYLNVEKMLKVKLMYFVFMVTCNKVFGAVYNIQQYGFIWINGKEIMKYSNIICKSSRAIYK